MKDRSGRRPVALYSPKSHYSHYAATGLYFYDETVVARAKEIEPSVHGELEINGLNDTYLRDGVLRANMMGRGYAWLDTGTHRSLLDASLLIQTIEGRQGLKVACLEEKLTARDT